MIYRWGYNIKHICKATRHWFRKLLCKDYEVRCNLLFDIKAGVCKANNELCEYRSCPKYKGGDE